MAVIKGEAGKTLKKRLIYAAGALAAGLFFAWLVARLLMPWAAGPVVLGVLLVFFKLFSEDKEMRDAVHAKSKGYVGERVVGQLLAGLPDSFQVFNDVDLDGENVDHVVVGVTGVFSVEVKNYKGQVVARPNGLYVNGYRQDRIVRQAWRQAHKLKARLGLEVQPVLVFVGTSVEGEAAGKLPVLTPDKLLGFIKDRPRVLGYAKAREALQKLAQRVA
jgi:hypothetical protein